MLAGGILHPDRAPRRPLLGSAVLPVTYRIAGSASGGFTRFMIVCVTFYGGEIVWRERDPHLNQIVDALPVPTWVPFMAKLLALWVAEAVILASLGLQASATRRLRATTATSPFSTLSGSSGSWGRTSSFSRARAHVHAVIQHKYLGHSAMVGFYLFGISGSLGLSAGSSGSAWVPRHLLGHERLRPLRAADGHLRRLLGRLRSDPRRLRSLMWTRGAEADFRLPRRSPGRDFLRSAVLVATSGLLVVAREGGASTTRPRSSTSTAPPGRGGARGPTTRRRTRG